MEVPQGTFTLDRLPRGHDPTLRAWDAADLYVLEHVAELAAGVSDAVGRVALVNDSFGALAVALAADPQPGNLVSLSDSALAHTAAQHNLAANGLDPALVEWRSPLDQLAGPLDVVVVKVPKATALLEFQLRALGPHLSSAAAVIGAGMTKQVHTSTIELFEQVIGPTSTSKAKKKARLIFSEPGAGHISEQADNYEPLQLQHTMADRTPVQAYPGVFSQRRLDQATELLIAHIPSEVEGVVLDVGCGSGALGLHAALANPAARVGFVDVSHLAIASARHNWLQLGRSLDEAFFLTAHNLEALGDASVGLVLMNPPFHADRSMGTNTAIAMFRDAKRVLEPGGQLMVVGNRHLGYHKRLNQLFGNCDLTASDPKFVVLTATRT